MIPGRVLILSKDSNFFHPVACEEVRNRHLGYAQALRRREPRSEVKIIAFGQNRKAPAQVDLGWGLSLHSAVPAFRPLFLVSVLKTLLPLLKTGWRPHLITAQTPWEEGLLGWALSRIFRCRFVAQIHFDLFSTAWKRESPWNGVRSQAARFLLRHSDGVRVVSTSLQKQVAEYRGKTPESVMQVAVPVNFHPSSLSPLEAKSALGIPEERAVVLFVGQFYWPKNLALWIETAAALLRLEPRAYFLLAGAGPEWETVRRRAAESGLSQSIRFLGKVKHSDLPDIYRTADVFLLTSRYEAFGRVLVESFLSRVPVVSTDAAGPRDLIENGVNGFLVPGNNAEDLAEKTLYLLRNPGLAATLGEKGFARVRDHYAKENLEERIVDSWCGR